ncbi:hypothetical protein ACA910_014087 [Epithemia clementina (nom. ined.)]
MVGRPQATSTSSLFVTALSGGGGGFPVGGSNNGANPNALLLDRFHVVCPADPSCVTYFDGGAVQSVVNPQQQQQQQQPNENNNKDQTKWIWAAVYRSNHNQPSVLVRDSLWQSMKLATTTNADINNNNNNNNYNFNNRKDNHYENLMIQSPWLAGGGGGSSSLQQQQQKKPVALACLRPSSDFDDCVVLDHWRCVLPKEQMDPNCDGGSEHVEALSVALDELLLQHFSFQQQQQKQKQRRHEQEQEQQQRRFQATIRVKGTLVSARVLEQRGFVPVQSLQRDMATHVSPPSVDAWLERYAQRAVATHSVTAQARQRALSLVSLLGKLYSNNAAAQSSSATDQDKARKEDKDDKDNNDNDNDNGTDYDPWANVHLML